MKYFAIPAILFALVSGASAQSIHKMPQGTRLNGTVEFGRFRLPLPPGDWTLIGATLDRGSIVGAGMAPPLGRVFLAQTDGAKLVATVEANGSVDPQNVEWSHDKECSREDFWFVESNGTSQKSNQICRYVTHTTRSWVAGTNWSESSKQAMQWLQEKGVTRPQQMISASYHRVRFGDLLKVTYNVNPEYFGQSKPMSAIWANSDWHKSAYPNIPKRLAFAQAWLDWSSRMAAVVADGFNRNANAAAPAFPFGPAAGAANAASVAASPNAVVGTRFVTGAGSFTITQADGSAVTTVNQAGQSMTWHPGGLLPLGSRATYDRAAAGSIFPLAVGKSVTFEQSNEGSTDLWSQSIEVVRAETVLIDEVPVDTFVIRNRTESLNPAQGGIVRIRTIWFAPAHGWIVRLQSEQIAGPPISLNSWRVNRIVPPS